ncbi:MAG: AMP-binding protein [Gemmatimonadetes bacterium]|nr:AMP-binding protein [Gemmatimonadota bacterium]
MTLPLFTRALGFGARTAIVAPEGRFSYADLLATSAAVASRLLGDRRDLAEDRICLLAPPGWAYVTAQWAIWRAGGIAVPMAVSHPTAELEHVLDDAGAAAVIAHPELAARVAASAAARRIPVILTTDVPRAARTEVLPDLTRERACLILYTSGTTGRPKGALLTHGNIQAQVESLSAAWAWTADDRVLLHLPLHHVHGIVNVLTSALWNGALCEIMPSFTPTPVWERLASNSLTLYMAVPTVYARLIDAWDAAPPEVRTAWSDGARACRLMVSGSAALPVPTLERWEQITGHRLLERYGMTEIGMALSNPLVGERRPGFVGAPLPGVGVRLADDTDAPVPAGTPGEVQVYGPTVFASYWERPRETAAAFTADGWFRTGDLAVVDHGAWRILGRSSVDILKTGGEKVSALEIEDVLRTHAAVADCAVVGVADSDWGERVCAAVVTRPNAQLSEAELRAYAKDRLAPYKVPKQILFMPELPRNPMGKVTKPSVRALFEGPPGT